MRRLFFVSTMLGAVLSPSSQETPSVDVGTFEQEVAEHYGVEEGLPSNDVRALTVVEGKVYASTVEGVAVFADRRFSRTDARVQFETDAASLPRWDDLTPFVGDNGTLIDAANLGTDHYAAVVQSGVFTLEGQGTWRQVFPRDATRSWNLYSARAVAFDSRGRFWFASPQGVGVQEGGNWTLYEGKDGLPFNNFTRMAVAPDDSVWFGTSKGAIHFDGKHWAYRQGKRWLPDDRVNDVVVTPDGAAWFATPAGVGVIRRTPMTLGDKAKFYEDEIDKYHRRTPYEYVLEVSVPVAGVKENWQQHDSDNDGLWTSMYGAGECFAYGATKDPKAKARAEKAFGAMEFLGKVTQGGSNPPPKGYVARTILPTDGPNPNDGRLDHDREEQKEDALWKVIDPRWPTSEDGKWYWKADTSSDELDGHYFFYGAYFDLVAESDEEKERVRRHVQALTDHLIDHGFNLVDHDGKPTRWARYSPEELNFDRNWFAERGLNSLSMLSYLNTTWHITGKDKYREIALDLIEKHGYAQNVMYPKFQRGIGTGNQSDDQMAFMCFYNLLKYETDSALRERYTVAWWQYWRLEQPELNPFFNFAFASQCLSGEFGDAWGRHSVGAAGEWLEDSVDSLKRFPLDRFDWAHDNTHRIDLVPVPDWARGFDQGSMRGRALRVNGKCLPVDERHFEHWNTDPFQLNQGGQGRGLADGAVFLLPYYMGLHHGFIEKDATGS